MMNPNCYYHPNREAITKCEACGKLICVECKMVFQQQHSTGTIENPIYYVTRHELCPPCYYDKNIKIIKSPSSKIIPIVIGFIFLVFITFIFIPIFQLIPEGFGSFKMFFLLILIIIICFCVGMIFWGIRKIILAPKKIEQMKEKKQEFLKNISPSTQVKGKIPSMGKGFCPHCGDKIDPDERICDQCGGEL